LAIDYSKTAIERLNQEIKNRGLNNLEAKQGDIGGFSFDKKYDLIVCIAVLHFLEEEKAKKLIRKCKENTNPNGINLFKVLRKEDPSQEEYSDGYYFKNNELKEMYGDWEIIEYKEYEEYDEDQEWDNKLALVIARKI
jgi:cyclopropane fatty-acyl-phospholipid synthase-like methyltransferase